ncbi:MAG TPA: transglycosylase domain-containing protein [Acidimicrobiales bacterium]|nr:transglycosylase domain-containing protein [Acidimicrobiales bacterium]
MAIRVPGVEPAESLQLGLPWADPDPPTPVTPRDGAATVAGAALAGGIAGAGMAAAALAAGVLVFTTALLALAWAALAAAGLLIGTAGAAVVAGAHGTARAWVASAPHRATARAWLARTGRHSARLAVVGTMALARATAWSGRAALRGGRATAVTGAQVGTASAVALAGGARRVGRKRLATVGRLRITGALVAVVVVVVAVAAWPTKVAVGVLSAAVAARAQPVDLPPLAQGSAVYDAGGGLVGTFHADDNRQPVPLAAVSPTMVDAVVDTEDARFWSHGGVDLRAILRAVKTDVGSGAARQGGSTIAEQLVKNLLLADHPDDLHTKVKEAVLANRVEGRIGKRAVLRDYLNTVYFGEGAYGVQAAAETYFAVPARQLGPAQAALLAGLIQDPNGYDPLHHPGAAATRRHIVLGLMATADHLSRAQVAAAAGTPLPTTVHLPPSGHGYYLDAVQHELLSDPRLGRTPQDRYRRLYYGGLRIHTGLAPALQAQAEQAVRDGVPGSPLPLSAALAAIEPATGAVRAVVGGKSYSTSQYDAATASPGRQTGSAFKMFTLVAALEAGYSPRDAIDGSGPCRIPNPGGTPDPWVAANYESENFGTIDLTTAMAHSVNCAFARLAMMVGLPRIAETAHRMGVTAPLAVVPSMTLGTNDVPPLQMAAAYATLADDGVYHRPHFVTEVDGPGGRPLFRNGGSGTQVISSQMAREATAVLQQVVVQGTGKAAALPGGRQVAGKTGTTEQFQDAWFVGYTPQLAAAVWMGDLSGEVPMTDVGGISVAGGTYPARIWNAFMAAALQSAPVTPFPAPSSEPPGVVLASGQPRGAGPPAGPGGGTPGSSTYTTTWCWSSCGRGSPPASPGTPPPAPGPTGPGGPAPPPGH